MKDTPTYTGDFVPVGRWCALCDRMVPANHYKAMLMQRKPDHRPVVLFKRARHQERGEE